MRYEKAENLLRLCLMMGSRSQGVSIENIRQEFEVSRRTAERMRDAAVRFLPDVVESMDDSGHKYWRANNVPAVLTPVTAEDIGVLANASELMRVNNRQDAADRLNDLATKLLSSQPRKRQFQLEPDIELLMESEGNALRPGPRVALSYKHIETLREAMLSSVRIEVSYFNRDGKLPRQVKLEPFGLLYGQRPYLIARQKGKKALRHYRLQGLADVALTNESFARDEGFDLAAYSRKLFGVFSEPPFDVCWKFRPDVAADAAEYVFHPDQKTEINSDGSLTVRFRAGGAREMAWHLMTWGDAVEVIGPGDFWERAGLDGERNFGRDREPE